MQMSKSMDSHRQIEDYAARLLAKRDSGVWSAEDQAHLAQWMAESTAHRVAVLRLEMAWDDARRLQALAAGYTQGSVPPPGEWRRSPFFKNGRSSATFFLRSPARRADPVGAVRSSVNRWLLAAAGSLLLAAGVGSYVLLAHPGEDYVTPVGGIASVPLQDGSNITLNTASELRIELTPNRRLIRLERGEAFFEVSKDPQRPFVVQIGSKRVIAVGTKFSVRRSGDEIRVAVAEGKVRVEEAASAGRRESADALVPAGDVAAAGDAGILVQEKSLAAVEDDLSWRRGYLTFHETPLADAVAEFSRYTTHKITIADPQVAAVRISGTFRAVNHEAFIRLLGEAFSIRARVVDGTTVLSM
jgi:transmembrane sensor